MIELSWKLFSCWDYSQWIKAGLWLIAHTAIGGLILWGWVYLWNKKWANAQVSAFTAWLFFPGIIFAVIYAHSDKARAICDAEKWPGACKQLRPKEIEKSLEEDTGVSFARLCEETRKMTGHLPFCHLPGNIPPPQRTAKLIKRLNNNKTELIRGEYGENELAPLHEAIANTINTHIYKQHSEAIKNWSTMEDMLLIKYELAWYALIALLLARMAYNDIKPTEPALVRP